MKFKLSHDVIAKKILITCLFEQGLDFYIDIQKQPTVSFRFFNMSEVRNPIIIFQFYLKSCQWIGLYPSSQLNPKRRFNCRNISLLLSALAMGLSTTAYFIFKADSIQNRGISFYVSDSSIFVVSSYLSLIFKMTEIFDLIAKFKEFIEKSEL